MIKRLEIDNFSCLDCNIKDNKLFNNLNTDQVTQLNKNKACIFVRRKNVIFHEGSLVNAAFCVRKGKIKLYRTGIDGKNQIIRIINHGDVIGVTDLLKQNNHELTAEALEDTVICRIEKGDFLNLLDSIPLLKDHVTSLLSNEISILTKEITNLAQRSVRQRLAYLLLFLNDIYDNEITISRQDIADYVGASTENIIRELSSFKKEKLIQIEGKVISINANEKLKKIANF